MNINAMWTDDRVAELRRLRSEGYSSAQIASALGGGLTRNAVIGKAGRIGLTKPRPKPLQQQQTPKPRSTKTHVMRWQRSGKGELRLMDSIVVVDMVGDDNLSPQDIPVKQRKQLLELTFLDCRWPYGDPGTADFFFCGAQRSHDGPYCAAHARIAYQKAPSRVLSDEERARRSAATRRHSPDGPWRGSSSA